MMAEARSLVDAFELHEPGQLVAIVGEAVFADGLGKHRNVSAQIAAAITDPIVLAAPRKRSGGRPFFPYIISSAPTT